MLFLYTIIYVYYIGYVIQSKIYHICTIGYMIIMILFKISYI